MEDRHLYRGKRTLTDNMWVQWDGFSGVQPNTVIEEETICQCTGLKDKNGKLIWENDIIECKDGKHNFQTQIEWDAYCAGFIFQDTETSAVGLDAITENGLYSESKVVGNIFDNPELLEV